MFSRSFTRTLAQRQLSQVASRRFKSTAPSPNEALQKAQQGAEKALEYSKKYTGVVGERIGTMLGAYRQPIVYNSQVFVNFMKIVYRAERLSPPSLGQVQSTYSSLFHTVKDVAFWKDLYATGLWKKVAIGGLEVYGIFKIGEIIGRRSLVGYKLDE